MMSKDCDVSNGKVFADIGLPDSEQALLTAKLTNQLYKVIKARALMQREAARLLGTTKPQDSVLMRCKAVSASVERLTEFDAASRAGR